MKSDVKNFDCVEFMHDGALRIYEETKGMTVEQEMAYWRQKHLDAMVELSQANESFRER